MTPHRSHVLLALLATAAAAQPPAALTLQLTDQGVKSLTYGGVEYADPTGAGVLGLTGGKRYGNLWAPAVLDAHHSAEPFAAAPTATARQGATVTQTYPWGSLTATYAVKGDDLYVTATLSNASTTPIGWWKANLLALNARLVFDQKPWDKVMPFGYSPTMHYDYRWAMWGGGSDGYETWNFTDPHVYWWVDRAAPFEAAPVKILFADLDPKWQTGVYHLKTDHGDAWPVCAAADGDPDGKVRVPPGGSDTARLVLRFRPVTESALTVCADGYEAFGRAYPRTVIWTDRRPIGTWFGCRGNSMGGTNPNGWFNDKAVNTLTAEGRAAFAKRLLAEVDTIIATLTETEAQGVLWWDVEGARWPQPITYIGDPRVLDPAHPQHDQFAPELDTPVTYNGKEQPLIDACFAKLRDAGFKTGVTIRPQLLAFGGGSPKQNYPPDAGQVLLDKVAYARQRWRCTLFYVDSISEWFGNWDLEKVVAKYPDVLLMPEWGRTRSYRHSSPFSYTRFTGFYRGVPAEMQACWPDAFCCMGNVDYNKNYDDALAAVKAGNLQMFNCWYLSDEAKKIKQIYRATGVKHTPRALDQTLAAKPGAAVTVTLRATDEDGGAVTYTILGPPAHGRLGALDAAAGTVSYTPEAGYAGPDAFSFKATGAAGLNSNRGLVTITVQGAQP